MDSCGVAGVTYSWSVVSGNDIAAIIVSSTGSTVNVSLSGSGSFTLQLINTVTCSDGSSCSYYAYHTETVTTTSKKCTCQTAPIVITPTNKQGSTWTYSGTAPGTCTGEHGTEP